MPSQRTLDDNAEKRDPANARVLSSAVAPPTTPPTSSGPAVAPPPSSGRLLDRLSSEERKTYPMATGLLDYFPDACAMVSHVSYLGNQKHNPGQPLHWSRGKSADHADCVVRHMSTRNSMDGTIPHLAEAAWRALAELQIGLEKEHALAPPPGAR